MSEKLIDSLTGIAVTPTPSIYDPMRKYDVLISDVEYRRAQQESWLARVYKPRGAGPFPALLCVHGGAWSGGDRHSERLIAKRLATTGLIVVAIDFRSAPYHPYPAQVADINYATRWLKSHAADFDSDARFVGGLGSSSGGHTVMLSAMRPHDPRYTGIRLPESKEDDATLMYVLATWPVLDPYSRYLFAKETGRSHLVTATEGYFVTEDAMREGNPQLILDRGEDVTLPPALVIHGTADENVPSSISERFSASYRSAGGAIELELFPDQHHGFGRSPGPETNRALDLMKSFVACQLARFTSNGS